MTNFKLRVELEDMKVTYEERAWDLLQMNETEARNDKRISLEMDAETLEDYLKTDLTIEDIESLQCNICNEAVNELLEAYLQQAASIAA